MHCIILLKARSVRCPGKNFRTCNPYLSGGLFSLWEVTARYIRAEGWEPVISCDSPELLRGSGDRVAVFYQFLPWSFQIDTEDDYSFYLQMRPDGNESPPLSRTAEHPYRIYPD